MATEDCFIVRDDTSRAGLRRVHLLRSKGQIEREEVLRRWVGPGQVEGALEYQDEAGIWHLRLYWKEGRVENGEW